MPALEKIEYHLPNDDFSDILHYNEKELSIWRSRARAYFRNNDINPDDVENTIREKHSRSFLRFPDSGFCNVGWDPSTNRAYLFDLDVLKKGDGKLTRDILTTFFEKYSKFYTPPKTFLNHHLLFIFKKR